MNQKNGDETLNAVEPEGDLDLEQEREPESKPRSVRGKGINGRGGGRGKSKRGVGQKRSIITRGTPRQDDATPLPESQEHADSDALVGDAAQTPAETADEVKIPAKTRRVYKKPGVRSNLEPRPEYPFAEEQAASQEIPPASGEALLDAKPEELKDIETPADLD